ncbi:hypothetical protein BGZ65_010878 [Modicella reniformis]|uniref:Pyrimidine 5-nucleotidase n=1 Tax=Modicella reniformis TaxID=1440133 RepID=A0A9P6J6P3_9FUNG|nr:hypothetical protein BGZ65_010878 [Modicella reniformis]
MPAADITIPNDAVEQNHDCVADGPSTLDIDIPTGLEAVGQTIDRSITPTREPRVFFFDIDNCLYPMATDILNMMRVKIEDYFKNAALNNYEALSCNYYVNYGLAIRGLVLHHPGKKRQRALGIVENSSGYSRTSLALLMIAMDIRRSTFRIMVRNRIAALSINYDKVDGSLPLEELLHENIPLRDMIKSMKIEKKWLFTNAGKKHALRVIKCLGLEGCFDGLTYCDYLKPDFDCKPDTAAFNRAMRDAGVVHGSSCFLVDDSAPNINNAVELGWTAVHVAEVPQTAEYGHFQIDNILELRNVLPQLWESNKMSEHVLLSKAAEEDNTSESTQATEGDDLSESSQATEEERKLDESNKATKEGDPSVGSKAMGENAA